MASPSPSSRSLQASIAAQVRSSPRTPPGSEDAPRGEAGQAAVLALFRLREGGTEVLMIRRAERADDPWSGHIALPGGRWDPEDDDLRTTALREAQEEVGLDPKELEAVPVFLEFRAPANRPALKVAVFTAVLRDGSEGPTVPGDEVAAMFWAPVRSLHPAEITIEIPGGAGSFQTPALLFQEFRVWGFTRKVFLGLMEQLGPVLP